MKDEGKRRKTEGVTAGGVRDCRFLGVTDVVRG